MSFRSVSRSSRSVFKLWRVIPDSIRLRNLACRHKLATVMQMGVSLVRMMKQFMMYLT
jgi:hypothetical protein